jgi:mRNA-degrading endonuclease RelE of RelBE toxin-antitoxin system
LAYEVKDKEIVVIVLKIGKRDKFYPKLCNREKLS